MSANLDNAFQTEELTERRTNRLTERRMSGQTDKFSYKDARTHIRIVASRKKKQEKTLRLGKFNSKL